MSIIDTLLEVGTVFDYITPAAAEVQDLVNGPNHTILIPEGGRWSGRNAINLLRKHGIKTWGHMTVNRTIMITVPQAQARWGEHLLAREGVPVQSDASESERALRARYSRRVEPKVAGDSGCRSCATTIVVVLFLLVVAYILLMCVGMAGAT